ncbi:MAG: M1 family metallopeptidase [Chlorobi bacterium]|nr:M1 family metallopeptidase [Chlorobiota bacterium]
MKVKKNKYRFPIILFFFTFLIGIIVFFEPLSKFYDIIVRGGKFATAGFSGEIISDEALEKYYAPNQKKIDVLHYSIHIDLHPKEKIILGKTGISFRVTDPTLSAIDLNFYDNMIVDSLFMNGSKVKFTHDGTLLSFSKPEKSDSAKATVYYHGSPKSLGFGSFNFGKFEKKDVVYSLSEPIYASTWFPCNDMPTDKALADIYITNDTSKTSVSNGKLIETLIFNDRKTFHWKTFYPIATYLIAIYSADYSSFTDEIIFNDSLKMPLEYYAFPEHLEAAKIDFKINKDALKFFSKKFGQYPFAKEKYGVAEFLWDLGAMEHQTITGIGEKFVSGKNFFKDVYIHELAHQWWGDAVSPKTWNDVWLNEGFATYSEALYWEARAGEDALESTMLSKFDDFSEGTLYNPGTHLFSDLIYNKGAWTLHMLRAEIGDEMFFKTLRTYYEKFKYKNASTDDFKNVAEKISGKDLKKFFDQWVYKGEGIPELEIKYLPGDKSSGKFNISISQKQKKYPAFYFPLEIRFSFPNRPFADSLFYISSKDTVISVNVSAQPAAVEVDRKNKLLAKIKIINPVGIEK